MEMVGSSSQTCIIVEMKTSIFKFAYNLLPFCWTKWENIQAQSLAFVLAGNSLPLQILFKMAIFIFFLQEWLPN